MDDGFIVICLGGDQDQFKEVNLRLFGLAGSGCLKRLIHQWEERVSLLCLQGQYKETKLVKLVLALASLRTQAEGKAQSCHV